MQNKGFIKTFSIILTLICLFYLSFTYVGRKYDRKAVEYAKGDLDLRDHYLDSLSTEKVYLGKTLKEVREKEIGLGLDLKGGMNVIVEMNVAQMLRVLANTDDPQFNEAVNQAVSQNKKGSGSDFITLFQQNYEKINPSGKLAGIFSVTMSDRISPTSSNSQVIDVLKAEVKSAADNSFKILSTRIDHFGVVAPNIQRLSQAERILIELPGIKEPERVRKLLQGSANLEFWKTYNTNELAQSFNQLESRSAEYVASLKSSKRSTPNDSVSAKNDSSLIADSSAVGSLAVNSTEQPKEEQVKINKRFSEYFAQPYFRSADGRGCIVGTISKNDTAAVSFLLTKYKDLFPSDTRFCYGFKAIDAKESVFELFALKGDGTKRGPALEGDAVSSAKADQDHTSGSAWVVSMKMNPTGASRWATITGAETGRAIAIVLDGAVYSAPNVNGKIEGGNSQITGKFSAQEAQDLENVLKSGKMKAGVRIVQEDIVGPSLGNEAIQSGFISFIIALLVLFVFTCFLYGFTPGMVTNVALLINFFFMLGTLAAFQAVLTLPGIAGMVLSLAIAVDANILINERIKEELGHGKSLRKSIEDGYKHAFSAIFDSNLTSIITSVILAIFGTGAIRGFAVTLIIGISASFITAVFLTRMMYDYMMEKGKWQNLSFHTNISMFMNRKYNFDFVKISRKAQIVIGIFIFVCIASLFTLKLNAGIDFTGGRNYVIRFDEPVKTNEIQEALTPHLDGAVQVITIGSSNQVRVSTNYMIDVNDDNIETKIVSLIGEGLKDYVKPGKDITDYIKSQQKVGPSVAKDTLNVAFIALILAIICMALYIFIRFRNWAFSMGTIVSLVVDSFAVVGFYSLLWKFMPFSMEIDQTFIAAILTIIGYSLNDKVVVFDRFREYRKSFPNLDLYTLTNNSLNSTLTRTINTSMATALVVLCIFFFGGNAVRSFVFAMFLGIVIGTFTTLYISAPLAHWMMERQQKKNKVVSVPARK